MAFQIKTLAGLVNAALHIKTAGGIVPVAVHEKTTSGVLQANDQSMKIGMNLGWITTWAGVWPFSNIAYNMGEWVQFTGIGAFSQDQGVLTAATPTDRFRAYLSDAGAGLPAGTYTVKNPDGCKVAIGSFSGPSDFSPWTNATEFTFSYNGTASGFLGLWVEGSLTNAVGNLAIILPGHVASWNAGNVWNSEFIEFHLGLGTRIIRTMDWTCASSNIEADWSDRTTTQGISLKSPAAGGSCVPWEFIGDIANRLSADVWVCVPTRASQSYVKQMATVLSANTTRKVYLELGNEIWNWGNPWGEGTSYVSYLNYTKRMATAGASNTYTLNGHGLSSGAMIRCFATIENRPVVGVDWRVSGGENFIEVITQNTFKIHSNVGLTDVIPIATGQQNLLFVVTAEPGKSVAMDANYGALCLRNWDEFDSVMGASRVVRLVAAQAANPSTTSARLSVPGVSAAASYVAIAPYFYGVWWGAAVDIASGQLTPKLWANLSKTVYVSVYLSTDTPSVNDAVLGTGAINTQAVSYSAGSSAYSNATAVASLTNGVAYKVHFVVVDTYGDLYRIIVDATPSVTVSTQYGTDTYSNQATRNRMSSAVASAQVQATADVSGSVPVICYEGGLHFHESAPTNIASWLSAYQESAIFGDTIKNYLYGLSAYGAKSFCYYGDVLGTSFSIANSYTDTSDSRYVVVESLGGSVKKRKRLTTPDIIANNVTTEPDYPYVVYAATNAALTYSIVAGDKNGNFAFSGRDLLLTNGAGISWTTPTNTTLTVEASDGFQSEFFNISFALGDAWYASDSIFAWDSIADTNSAAINPSVGSTLAKTSGSGAVVSGGLWDMDSNAYSGSLAGNPLSFSRPILFAAVLDKDNQTSLYAGLIQLGSFSRFLQFSTGSSVSTAFCIRAYQTSPSFDIQTNFSSNTPSGKHVYWWFYNPVEGRVYAGVDQSQNNFSALTFATNTVADTTITIANSQMKHGSIEVVNRVGMTLSDALAVVAKMQAHHGIP